MKLSNFDYSLPKELIAQFPEKKRDTCKLLVIDRKSKKIIHTHFRDIVNFLNPSDCMVLNNTKVIPARLLGRRLTGGKVEVFLLKRLSDGYSYKTLIKPLRRLKLDEKILFDHGKIFAQLKDAKEKVVRFNIKNSSKLLGLGQVPLPPYIKRSPNLMDKTHYQTVYAKHNGSVASPTAGLHFTKSLISEIENKGVDVAHVTLHVNYSTFNTLKEEEISKHKMHSEEFIVSKKAIKHIKSNKDSGNKIVAVGTTSCRVLETVADKIMKNKNSVEIKSETDLFIYPGFNFKMVDKLITNFHLPRTSLFMLVCAFAGRNLIMKAYKEAVRKEYRFYSYGDAMMIL